MTPTLRSIVEYMKNNILIPLVVVTAMLRPLPPSKWRWPETRATSALSSGASWSSWPTRHLIGWATYASWSSLLVGSLNLVEGHGQLQIDLSWHTTHALFLSLSQLLSQLLTLSQMHTHRKARIGEQQSSRDLGTTYKQDKTHCCIFYNTKLSLQEPILWPSTWHPSTASSTTSSWTGAGGTCLGD